MYGWTVTSSSWSVARWSHDLARHGREFFFESRITALCSTQIALITYPLSAAFPEFDGSCVYERKKAGTPTPRAGASVSISAKRLFMWTRNPQLAGSRTCALLRFWRGPPAEGLQDEGGYYRDVVTYFMLHPTRQTTIWSNRSKVSRWREPATRLSVRCGDDHGSTGVWDGTRCSS